MHKSLIGYCGIYCAKCPIYLSSTTSDYQKKAELARELSEDRGKKLSPEDIHCWGCRSANKNCWKKRCQFRKCAGDKGIEFCYQCSEYPCPELETFYETHPESQHNLTRICKVGVNAFIAEMAEGGEEND